MESADGAKHRVRLVWSGLLLAAAAAEQQPSSQQQAAIRTAAKCDHNRYLFLRGHNCCLEPGGAFY